jgi:hypothetical protein
MIELVGFALKTYPGTSPVVDVRSDKKSGARSALLKDVACGGFPARRQAVHQPRKRVLHRVLLLALIRLRCQLPDPVLRPVRLRVQRLGQDLALTQVLDETVEDVVDVLAEAITKKHALTVDWFEHNISFPKVTTDEYLRQCANDMLTLLQNEKASPIPSLTYGSNVTNAYIQISRS